MGKIQSIRWGLIGAGNIAEKRVADALRSAPGSELQAASRRNKDKLREFAARYQVRKTYQNWKDLVVDQDIDAVYVATPVALHKEMTVSALLAGKHVLCEKPMALTVRECDEMIAAARDADRRLGIAYYRHHYPLVHRLKEILQAKTIGSAVLAHVNAFEWFDPQPDHPRHWLLQPEVGGGGPLMDFGCHRLEVLLALFGRIKTVSSHIERVTLDRAVEDTAVVTLTFTTGPVATLTVTHASGIAQDSITIYGTNGRVHIPKLNGDELELETGGVRTVEHHPPDSNLHLPLVQDFLDAIRSDREPEVNGAVGRSVNEILDQAYRRVD